MARGVTKATLAMAVQSEKRQQGHGEARHQPNSLLPRFGWHGVWLVKQRKP